MSESTTRPATPTLLQSIIRIGVSAAVVAIGLATLGGILSGRPGVEKTLTELLYPVGFLWWLLTSIGFAAFVSSSRRTGCSLLCCSAVLWCCGTSALPNLLISSLEKSVPEVFASESDPPLDVLVVLGGGTTENEHRAQAASSGDRVVYAAQLYHQGHAKRLITTGSEMGGIFGRKASPSQQTIDIWTKLAIPVDAISTLPGINTYQELESVAGLPDDVLSGRIGILTSAWHLPRAMRLARSRDLGVIPVAADYRAYDEVRFSVVPRAKMLLRLRNAQHEYMAYFLGR